MPLNGIVRNKYKLMAIIIVAYLLTDMVLHKGLVRVLIHKAFPDYKISAGFPGNKNKLINSDKEWLKAVDTRAGIEAVKSNTPGLECDVYFNREKNRFDIHHDADNSTGFYLDDLLEVYRQKELKASIWLDFKNLNDSNGGQALNALLELRNKFGLNDKLLVESFHAGLLKQFSDSGFYTAYYTPMFNPYFCSDDSLKHWVDQLREVIDHSSVNALSGYYFQYPFLHHYFPNFPILIWCPHDKFSLVNWWYKRSIANSNAVFIALYP